MVYFTQKVNNLLAIKDLNFTNIQIEGACALLPPPQTSMCVYTSTNICSRSNCSLIN